METASTVPVLSKATRAFKVNGVVFVLFDRLSPMNRKSFVEECWAVDKAGGDFCREWSRRLSGEYATHALYWEEILPFGLRKAELRLLDSNPQERTAWESGGDFWGQNGPCFLDCPSGELMISELFDEVEATEPVLRVPPGRYQVRMSNRGAEDILDDDLSVADYPPDTPPDWTIELRRCS